MTWGKYSDGLLDGSSDPTTMPFLANQPVLTDYDEIQVVEAFQVLSSSRNINMAVGSVPFSELANYADRINVIDWWGFVYMFQSLDNEYVKISNEKAST